MKDFNRSCLDQPQFLGSLGWVCIITFKSQRSCIRWTLNPSVMFRHVGTGNDLPMPACSGVFLPPHAGRCQSKNTTTCRHGTNENNLYLPAGSHMPDHYKYLFYMELEKADQNISIDIFVLPPIIYVYMIIGQLSDFVRFCSLPCLNIIFTITHNPAQYQPQFVL